VSDWRRDIKWAEGPTLRALSVKPEWADGIRRNLKGIELRKKPTSHRGPLVICASARPDRTARPTYDVERRDCGLAVCVVNLVDCRRAEPDDTFAACVAPGTDLSAFHAWCLAIEVHLIVEPFPVKGQLAMFTVTLPRPARGRRFF